MAAVLRRHTIDAGKAVKYTPCAKGDQTDEEELDEIAVVSKEDTHVRHDDEPEQGTSLTANGPRVLPGPGVYQSPSDRTKLIGERLSSSGRIINLSSPVYSGKVIEQKSKSTSKQSLLEIVSNRIGKVTGRSSRTYSKDEVAFLNKARSNETMTTRDVRKARRKDIADKFGKKQRFERLETSSDSSGCKWTFVFDPSGRLAYWWSFVVSIAFLYNFWVIIYRAAFEEIGKKNMAVWFTLDYTADLLYICDIVFHFRTGYLEDGVLQTDATKLRIHYMNSTVFYIDLLCLLPLDFLYLSIGINSLLRCFRLVKIYRFWAFIDRTERHTNYPNAIRTITLLHYLFAIYHWNACLVHRVSNNFESKYNDDGWQYSEKDDVIRKYLHSVYWSTLTLTTISDMPRPKLTGEYVFVIVEYVFGLLLFSTILGHVANIVANISAARKDFQAKLDAVKTYMSLRRVPLQLQDRVIKWFDYLWMSKKSTDEEKTMFLLPDKLKAEIALHIHLDTLKRVDIFQNTEAGFLCELVLRLRPVLFSPGDYICRKGEVGKEMYIVNRGRLQVVADNGKTVLATLRPGSYFGEISILNMGAAGNRRTASVRSVGYSDLFCLSKQDLWDVLKEYPAARVRLEAIAVKRLEKYKKAPLEKGKGEEDPAAISRSKSTPGQLETTGKVPLQAMLVPRHNTLPAGLLTPMSSQVSPEQSEASESVQSALSATSNAANGSHHSGSIHAHPEREGIDNGAIGGCEDEAPYVSPTTNASPHSADNAMEKSLVTTDYARSFLSPPLSPRPNLAPIPLGNLEEAGTASVSSSDGQSASLRASSSPAHPSTLVHFPPHTTIAKENPFGSPFQSHHAPANYPTHPTVPAAVTGIQNIPLSQPVLTFTDPGSNLMASNSSGSLRDPSQEILLQEITRLRERLATLETENTAMSIKLNQQQWEVEHRLAEIEMHICGSDSVGSQCSDEKSNKESVI